MAKCCDCAAPDPSSQAGTGASEIEIEITREMVEAGTEAVLDREIAENRSIEISTSDLELIISASFGAMLRASR